MNTNINQNYQSESVYQTIHHYLHPEMRILVSGFGFSYLPLPCLFIEDFKGCYHELIEDNIHQVCKDVNFNFTKTLKNKGILSLQSSYDFIYSDNGSESIRYLKSLLKPGGYLFFMIDKNSLVNKHTFLNLEFELIENYQNKGFECFFVKKGWS